MIIGSWVDCANPFYKINHGYFKKIEFPSNQGFCPSCWYDMLRLEIHPKATGFRGGKPIAFKQCGPDTL